MVKWKICPKIWILSLVTHPCVFPNLYDILFTVEHKIIYQKTYQATLNLVDFYGMGIFQNIFFYVPQKKVSHWVFVVTIYNIVQLNLIVVKYSCST